MVSLTGLAAATKIASRTVAQENEGLPFPPGSVWRRSRLGLNRSRPAVGADPARPPNDAEHSFLHPSLPSALTS